MTRHGPLGLNHLPDAPPAPALDLLGAAPNRMHELPTWFASLTPEQLHRVWVQAFMAVFIESSFSADQATAALKAVRDHEAMRGVELPKKRRCTYQPDSVFLERLDAACPNAGDSVVLRDLVKKHEWVRTRDAAAKSGRYAAEAARLGPKGKAVLTLRRIG